MTRPSTYTSRDGAQPVHTSPTRRADWSGVRDQLRARGLRWTPQRRTLIEVLSRTDGHVTGAELIERCRAVDPTTIPSTVYRTLDVLEEPGPGPPQPRRRRPRGVPRPARAPSTATSTARRAGRPGRSRPTRRRSSSSALRAEPRLRRRRDPPVDRRRMRRVLGEGGSLSAGTTAATDPLPGAGGRGRGSPRSRGRRRPRRRVGPKKQVKTPAARRRPRRSRGRRSPASRRGRGRGGR